jgi:outer membrane protein TolC
MRVRTLSRVIVALTNAALAAMCVNTALAQRLLDASPDVATSAASICGSLGALHTIDLADALAASLEHEPHLIMAQQDDAASRSDLLASTADFYPSLQLSLGNERYVPSNGATPVVVVGNSVLGGAQTKSAYGALSLNWNLMSSGRGVAAYRSAKASLRAADSGLDSQLQDTFTGILQAEADLYEAEITTTGQASALTGLKAILARANERYRNGHGTTVAIGQARSAALDAEQSTNRACQTLADKSAALAQAIGIRVPASQLLGVAGPLPFPIHEFVSESDPDVNIEKTPAVQAAKDNVAAARAKLHEAQRAFGPTVSLSVRRDYLGEDPDSFAAANHHIAPSDYRVGLSFAQPLLPFVSEVAQVDKARAQLRRAQASYDQALLEAQTKLRNALNAQHEAQMSYRSAISSLAEAERVLTLTNSLYHAGRTDLDGVEHAQMDAVKAETDLQTLESRRSFAQWVAARALEPEAFPGLLIEQLHLRQQMQRWREESQALPPSDSPSESLGRVE